MSTSNELLNLNLKSASREGCEEIASGFVNRLQSNASLQNPWITWRQSSEELAEELYQRRNRPLSGVILGIKDVISTENFQTKMGTDNVWKNPDMGFNARIVSIAKELGVVIGGKTKSSEFAVHQETDVINPKYPGRTSGTSSAGSAAAVANGTVELALATQTAGSIARPSSYCGVVGFKPTFGDFPRTGVLKTTDEFDTLGVIGKNPSLIRDFYLLTRLTGQDYPLLESRRKKMNIQKVVILVGEDFDSSDTGIQELVEEFYANKIKKIGFSLIPSQDFKDFNKIRSIHQLIYRRDLSYYFKDELKEGKLSPNLRDFINLDKLPTQTEYIDAITALHAWRRDFQSRFANTLILSLAASSAARISDQAYENDLNAAITAAGFPQLCIPAITSSENMNISLSMSGPKGSDEQILDLGIELFKFQD